MDLNKLEQNIANMVRHLADKKETNDKTEFIYNFLLAYEFPKATITRLKKGDYNQSKKTNEDTQEILWKKHLFFKVEQDQDLHLAIDKAQKDATILKHHPRFMIVTDFKRLLAVDTKRGDSLDISLHKLSEHYTFFLPWAGMEKTQIQSLNLADTKAAEKLAQLYDIIIQENHIETDTERHGLNIFLSRLLFCFFAEDTGIFEEDQFTNAIASHTQKDGSDCQEYLIALFKVMNTKGEQRTDEAAHIKAFPYVNGGLFAVDYPAPKLNTKARKMIIDAGTLNWKQINPDIFGSMMQAVVHSDQRGSLGMHYTSVINIMKVIEPLFLNDLKEQLEKAEGKENKLTQLLDRIYHLRLFDPACGSGNFLIIAYKELCRLEIEIFTQLQQISNSWKTATSGIQLTQFYGIELDDFAHETAKLSLWLAEHQMNLEFKSVFGSAKPTLPLQDGEQLVCGNATRVDWETVCPKAEGAEIYIMGNPPYLGSTWQSNEQKSDLSITFSPLTKRFKSLDYVAIWFMKGAIYCSNKKAECAFVATNSICQGQQVALLWPLVFAQGIEISFAHQSFQWKNLATNNAGVTCVIVGLRQVCNKSKYLFTGEIFRHVQHIGPYLIEMSKTIVKKLSRPLNGLPEMLRGNGPTDGGNLILSPLEKNQLLEQHPQAEKLIRRLYGSQELIKGVERYCLWITDKDLALSQSIAPIAERINKVREMRLSSRKVQTQEAANRPHQFAEIRKSHAKHAIIIPRVSSEHRPYLPVDILSDGSIIQDRAFAIYDGSMWVMAVIASKLHLQWIATVCVRLETRFSYSNTLGYNTFPFPEISEAQKTTLEDHVFNVLDEREKHPEKTMAELYDPDKMPDGLRQAHTDMDVAVEQCYRTPPFKSDEERLEYLFKLYEAMIKAEKLKK